MSYEAKYERVDQRIVKVTLTATGETKKGIPLVVLDRSGSMAGSRLQHCIGALQELNKTGPFRLISYENTAMDHGVCASLPFLSAGGGTSFCAAWEQVIKSEHNGPIAFMSDGEDGSGFAKQRMGYMRRLPRNCQIFCVGVESQSNTQDLIDLSKAGPIQGEYTFFSTQINNYAAEAQLLARQIFAEPIKFMGQHYHLGAEPLQIYIEDSAMACETSASAAIDYLGYKIDQLIKRGSSAPLEQVQALRDQATDLFLAAGRLDRTERKQQRSRLQPVYQLVSQFYELRHKNLPISHEQLAKLALSARDARSSRFAKLAVDRANKNMPQLEAEDKLLKDMSAALDTHAIAEAQPMLSQMQCMVSCKNVVELMADGDCMGIGLQCVAREACIADPTLLQIKDVGTSYLGCGEFLEASEWAADEFGISFKAPTRVLDDGSRTSVNAVLPLYICEEHWKFAKLHVQRMTAHATCKDPVQGSRRHTFYTYLLAWQAASAKQGDFFKVLAADLQQVIKRIGMPIPTPEQFLQIDQRMPDAVPSLALLKVAYQALQVDCPLNFDLLCAEETLRREAKPIAMDQLCPVPDALIRPYVLANTGGQKGDLFAPLRAKLIGRPDVLQALDKIQQASTNRKRAEIIVPDAQLFHVPPVLDARLQALTALNPLPERIAIIALQAWRLNSATDCVAHYKNLYDLDEAEIKRLWHTVCVDQLLLLRKAALTSVLQKQRGNTLESDLQVLSTGSASPLQWAAILHRSCYIGRNIKRYAESATTLEQIQMLCIGRCDIGAILGTASCQVKTVKDIKHVGRWVPSVRVRQPGKLYRRWRELYSVGLLRVISVEADMRLRHWASAVRQLKAQDPALFQELIQEPDRFWVLALQAIDIKPATLIYCPPLQQVLEALNQ